MKLGHSSIGRINSALAASEPCSGMDGSVPRAVVDDQELVDGVERAAQANCPLVMIEWEDSARPAPAWQHLSDFEPSKTVSCASVGWLIEDGDKTKALAPNMGWLESGDDAQACGIIRIPTRAVTRITHLRDGEAISSSAACSVSSCEDPSPRPAPKQKRRPS